ncbi:MAG: hypothetical protein H6918_06955 [Sphingomonadaceae bacterium]|nr:hypothetical protein [Sphingomonadaceae bacterium]
MRQIVLPFLACLTLPACATSQEPAPALAASEYLGEDRAETAARLFAIAADSEGVDEARHERAVLVLQRLGLKPAEGEADVLTRWSAALPEDRRPPLRGRLLGPAYRSGVLEPGATLSTNQLFEGGKKASVSLSGKSKAALAVQIHDQRERNVCAPDPGNPRNCRWTPPYSGRYSIKVSNPGEKPVRYFLVIE